jgi:hypothetical protein
MPVRSICPLDEKADTRTNRNPNQHPTDGRLSGGIVGRILGDDPANQSNGDCPYENSQSHFGAAMGLPGHSNLIVSRHGS